MKNFASVVAFALTFSFSALSEGRAQGPGQSMRQALAGAPTILYGGVIEYMDYVKGPNGWDRETVFVSVVRGEAFCEGAVQSAGEDGIKTNRINGEGLLQVFFQNGLVWTYDSTFDRAAATEADVRAQTNKEKKDLLKREPVYSFVFACPPAYGDGRPADWNHSRESNNQPRPKTGTRPSACAGTREFCEATAEYPAMLCGSWKVPSGATDALNGITGTVTMRWRLCKGCSPPPRNYDMTRTDFEFPPLTCSQ